MITHSGIAYRLVMPCMTFPTGLTSPGEFEEEEAHDPNGETLILEARMQPLQMDTMTKSKDGFLGVRQQPAAIAC